MKKTESDFAKDSANMKKYEDAVKKAEHELAKINYEPGEEE